MKLAKLRSTRTLERIRSSYPYFFLEMSGCESLTRKATPEEVAGLKGALLTGEVGRIQGVTIYEDESITRRTV